MYALLDIKQQNWMISMHLYIALERVANDNGGASLRVS